MIRRLHGCDQRISSTRPASRRSSGGHDRSALRERSRRSPAAARASARPSAGGWPRRVRPSPRSISRWAGRSRWSAICPDAAAIHADVSDSASVEEALTQVESDLGPLAIMVNNAGALAMSHVARVKPLIEKQQAEQAVGRSQTPLEALVRLTDDEWRFVMSVHLDGTFYGTRAAVKRMAPRGEGAIVNMASICGIEGCTGHPHYSAAKAGVLGFTRATAKEVIVQGIRVNAIAPGFIDTTRTKATGRRGARGQRGANARSGRLGTPEEVAATVAFLASDDAASSSAPRSARTAASSPPSDVRALPRRARRARRCRRAISPQSSRGRSWPIPSNTTSSAPGIAAGGGAATADVDQRIVRPCITSVGTRDRPQCRGPVAGGERSRRAAGRRRRDRWRGRRRARSASAARPRRARSPASR